MVFATYQKKFLTICQIWYEDIWQEWKKEKKCKEDLLFFHGIRLAEEEKKKVRRNALITDFHSLLCDLTLTEEELLNDINKTERYQIRKSGRDEVTVEIVAKEDVKGNAVITKQLKEIYEEMYREKGFHYTFNESLFQAYCEKNMIVISGVFQGENPLVLHSYVVDEKNARLLHSVSEFRNENVDASLVGRANKRLHWEDILYFKQQGMITYDWGGISSIENPNGIDTFKMKFGGTLTTYQNMVYGNSFLGKIAILGMKLLGKGI